METEILRIANWIRRMLARRGRDRRWISDPAERDSHDRLVTQRLHHPRDTSDEGLSVADAARQLNITPRTVRRRVKRGELRAEHDSVGRISSVYLTGEGVGAMNSDGELDVLFEGGPRDGETDTIDGSTVVIGDGGEGGVYQRTDEERDGLAVYRWQQLTDAEAAALVRGEVHPAQEAEQ